MTAAKTDAQLDVRIFGNYRVIGLRLSGKFDRSEAATLWGRLTPRVDEIGIAPDTDFSFGICRCVHMAPSGDMEYIAGLPATEDAPIPEGMIETRVSAGTYAVIPVQRFVNVFQVWRQAIDTVNEDKYWQMICRNSDNCKCLDSSAFELYPTKFQNGRFNIYIPVRAKKGQ